MTPAHNPVSEEALLHLTAQSLGLEPARLARTCPLDDLDLSTHDFLALVAVLEDRCAAVLPDCDLARCETTGDLIDRLRGLLSPRAASGLNGRAHQAADTGGHGHGQRAPEGDPRRRAPRRGPAGFRASHAQDRQAS